MTHTLVIAALGTSFLQSCKHTDIIEPQMASIPKTCIPYMNTAPRIDGRFSENEYAAAKKIELVNLGEGQELQEATQVYIGWDDKNLYAAFVCHEADPKSMRIVWRTPEEHDNDVWTDDSVDVILDISNAKDGENRHFIVSAGGVPFDEYNGNTAWNPTYTTAVMIHDDSWVAEYSIPFSEIGCTPEPGDCWSINLGRSRPNAKEYSNLVTGAGGFRSPNHFVEYTFTKDSTLAPVTIQAARVNSGPNLHAFSNVGPIKANISALDPDGKKLGNAIETSFDGETFIDYSSLPPFDKLHAVFSNTNGKILREYILCAPRMNQDSAGSDGSAPLYEELFTDGKPGLAREGVLFWQGGMPQNDMRNYGIQFAERQTVEDYYKMLAKHNLLGISQQYTFEVHKQKEKADTFGGHFTLLPDYRPEDRTAPYLIFDPESKARYINYIDKNFKLYGDYYKSVFFADEIDSHVERSVIDYYARRNEINYPYIIEFAEEVRTKYGFGKYGIPEGPDDTNVYRWIALRSALADKLNSTMKDIQSFLKTNYPEKIFISDDPVAAISRVNDYGTYDSNTCDVITHQTYPRDNYSAFGFFGKFIRDLSAVDDIWPCLHVEEYGRSYTADEVRLKISEAVRNGANGIHFYLLDTTGRRSGKKYMLMDYNGAPDRHQIEMAIADEIAKMPPLKFPKPEIGVFTPVESTRAYMGQNNFPMHAFALHTLLERNAKTAFKHMNESSWKRNNLTDYKAIMVTEGKYISASGLKLLQDFAENGGHLIVFDSEAFSFGPDGTDFTAQRNALFGIKSSTAVTGQGKAYFNGIEINISSSTSYAFELADGAEALEHYQDGTISAVRNHFGKGIVDLYGINLGGSKMITNAKAGEFIRKLCEKLGAPLDCDIWRFEFPKSLIKEPPRPTHRYLTGNSIIWRHFKPDYSMNCNIEGATYTVTPAPAFGDAGDTPIPFATGRLTNRKAAVTTPSIISGKGSAYKDFMNLWTADSKVKVVFDFGRNVDIYGVQLTYLYWMRDVTVRCINGNSIKEYSFNAESPDKVYDMNEVRQWLMEVPDAPSCSKLELDFAPATQTPANLGLVEIDVLEK